MLGVVACVLAVVCKRMQQLPTMFGPTVHRGKDTTHKSLLTMRNERAWPNNVGRAVQTNPKLLRDASAITEQKKYWELLAENFDRFQTLRNNIQHCMKQGVQTDATCNIQQCWELLANNVASVSTGPKTEGSKEFNFWKDFYFALSENYLLQRHATHVCFHIIYQYRSSYIIKH